jgi:secreted Zn-dependent insulinase-like peptidase
VRALYEAHYTAANMKLVVCSTDSLDELQATVARTFAGVRPGGHGSGGHGSGGNGGSGGSGGKKKKKKGGGGDGGSGGNSAAPPLPPPLPSPVAGGVGSASGVWAPPPPLDFASLVGVAGCVYLVQPVRHANELRLVWGLGSEQLSKWRSKPAELVRGG